jgi:hypothetical protein
MQKRLELTLRLTPEELERFEELAYQRGRLKKQQILLALVRAWMKDPALTSGLNRKKTSEKGLGDLPYTMSPRWRPYFEKLARIFQSRNRKAIGAVTENIDVFDEYVQLQARPDEPTENKEGGPEKGGSQ